MSLSESMPPHVAHSLDAGAMIIVVAAFTEFLPHLAAILSIFWFAYQMYDLYDRRRQRKHGTKRRKDDYAH